MKEQATSDPIGVSVIVPAYNAESYISSCIKSVLSQSMQNIELVCIDDCSNDRTSDIIKREASKDSRIKAFFLERNSGAPFARNTGIDKCSGEYLLFLDADDRLAPNSLQILYLHAKELNCDAIKGCMLVTDNSHSSTPHHLNQKTEYLDTTFQGCSEIQHLYQYQSYLFKTSVIKKGSIRFNEKLKNFQDPVFLSHLLPACRRIDVLLTPIYIRNIVPDSIITSRWGFSNFESLVNGVCEAYAALQSSNNPAAARNMAKTFSLWWHKLAFMPSLLSREECFEIFTQIKFFSDRIDDKLADPVPGRMTSYKTLLLISEGHFDRAYRVMQRSLAFTERAPKPLRSLVELLRFVFHKWFRRAHWVQKK
ncbi:MAG: glycosyltransferase family 2 protein [Halioglobus sp.]|nr:glycosyltransferase family 2 protein [Halioglobus sp.]